MDKKLYESVAGYVMVASKFVVVTGTSKTCKAILKPVFDLGGRQGRMACDIISLCVGLSVGHATDKVIIEADRVINVAINRAKSRREE